MAVYFFDTSALIKRYAVEQGMRTLRESGLAAVTAGETTVEEVLRETI